MAEQSKLEQIAITKRANLLVANTYLEGDSKEYTATNSRAMSDSKTPIQGKGTGVELDTTNGGGDYDINGNPLYPGSGRKKGLAQNNYNNTNGYTAPDMSGNIGQVTID